MIGSITEQARNCAADGAVPFSRLPSMKEEFLRSTQKLAGDFAGGLTGTRFNTFEHRSRVVGHLAAEIRALQEKEESRGSGAHDEQLTAISQPLS